MKRRYVVVPLFVAIVFVLVLTGLVACGPPAKALRASLPTGSGPYMGYNTWYEYDSSISEGKVLAEASLLRSEGLAASGYTIVTLDDGWAANSRTASGSLTWDPAKFPHGIPWLALKLHEAGLKLGIYTAIGSQVCGPAPGSFGHYAQDANTFERWGVDFVKVDDCQGLPNGTTITQLLAYYRQFGTFISGDGMIYSEEAPVLQAPGSTSWLYAIAQSASFANTWRVAPDLHWTDTALFTISSHLTDDTHLHGFAGPGHWNDLDMLVPGTVDSHPFNWTLDQERAQLGVWAMEASPLFLSTNLAKLTGAELAAVANPDVIGIDQSGAQAAHAYYSGPVVALVKPYGTGWAVLLYNTGISGQVVFSFASLGLPATGSIRNVWNGRSGTVSGISVGLGSGASALYVVNSL